jgi:lysophosphatidylcholine acyltransferase/lyso-PAF acetyltransferase
LFIASVCKPSNIQIIYVSQINILIIILFRAIWYSAEGTTTNGDYLLPFKTGGFLAKAPVLPVILKYPYQRFSPAWDSISGVSTYIVIKLHGFQLLLIIKAVTTVLNF